MAELSKTMERLNFSNLNGDVSEADYKSVMKGVEEFKKLKFVNLDRRFSCTKELIEAMDTVEHYFNKPDVPHTYNIVSDAFNIWMQNKAQIVKQVVQKMS